MEAFSADRRREEVEARLRVISPYIESHAGGIELVDVSGSGAVKLRFTGMCTGCQYRPLTMAGTIRPLLLDVEGVTSVEAEGSRISVEAEERLSRYLGDFRPFAKRE